MSTKFSVIIPVYNREALIRETLDSVFAQTYDDYEVIVVDDGSTDDTVSVLEEYADRITILQQENQGPGAARNTGIRQACGEYVAFLDSDDRWFPWTLACYRDVVDTYDQPAFVAGQPFVFSNTSELEEVQRETIQTEAFEDYYASSDAWRWWGVSSFVMRTEALRRVGGFTDRWVNAEDADLAMRMGVEPGFIHIAEGSTFAYRQHKNSAMASVRKNADGIHYMIEQEKAGQYPGGEDRRTQRWQILTRHIRPTSLACLRAGMWRDGWWFYWNTMRWNQALGRWKYLLGFPIYALRYSPRSWSVADGRHG